jgi:hypothetical protein
MAWTTPATQTTGTLMTAALWNQQVTDNLTFLGASHDHNGGAGDGATITPVPAGLIAIWDANCPSGWTRVSAWDGKFIRGNLNYGGTAGADTHTHTVASHVHTCLTHAHTMSTVQVATGTTGPLGLTSNTTNGTIVTTGGQALTTDAGSTLPAYINVVFCKKDA